MSPTFLPPTHHHDEHVHPHPRPGTLDPEDRLRLVGDLARTLTTILDPQELIERITELITHRFDFYYSCVLLCEGDELVIRSAHGRDHGFDDRLLGLRLKIGEQGISGAAAVEGRTIIVPDVVADGRFRWAWPDHAIRSAMVVPLRGRKRLIGMLEADSDRLDDFDADDAVLLEALAGQLAIVIENAELLQAERKRARRLQTVTEIARKVTSILDLQELLTQTTELVAERFGYRGVSILLRDPADEDWLYLAAWNAGAAHAPKGYRQPVSAGMCGRAVRTGESQLANDTRLDPDFVQGPGLCARSELDVPIKIGGRVLGVLGIDSEQPDAFSEDDVPFVETLADQIAVAIENAKLVERARELATSEERNRVAREIHDTLAQSLAAVSLELDAAARLFEEEPSRAPGVVAHARDLAHRALEEARHAIWGLRPAPLTRLSLADAIAAEARSLEQGGAVEAATFVVQGEPRPLAPDLEAALFRIAQEALSNVRRHARARRARCALHFGERSVRLSIEDDGVGFDPSVRRAPTDGGFGLDGIRQRAQLVGAELEVDSSPGWGTRVRVQVLDAPPATDAEAAKPIRLLLADDHVVVRGGVRRLVEAMPGVLLVGEAATGEEAVARAIELAPDVILMDVQMPGLDGLEATRRIRAALPRVGVAVLSTSAPDDVVMEAVRAGARGYLLKDVGPDELRDAILAVAAGGSYFAPSVAAKLAGGVRRGGTAVERLTARELAVLRRLAAGATNKQIAASLKISENTVESHLRNIYGKLEVRSRTEALRRAAEWGILAVGAGT
jgi:DNA-binding NarL/FixJ family response regulator/signal transduction histidine kinase